MPTSQFCQGSGHSQGIKGWSPPPCWPGELRRGALCPVLRQGAQTHAHVRRAESVRREGTGRTVRWQEARASQPEAGRKHGFWPQSLRRSAGEGTSAHARESLQCPGAHGPGMIFLGPGFLLGKSFWGALLLLRCSSWGNSLEPARDSSKVSGSEAQKNQNTR